MTLRNGRYVVPVRAEARSKVKGIVHDASGSGQTLFVEPLVVVELGNAWREAQAAVDEEVGRILDALSALVAANATMLKETLEALAQFDFWVAKAQLASEMDGDAPRRRPARGGRPPVGAPPRADRQGRPDRHPPRRRLHGARHHGPQHRRQDGRPADARAARASCTSPASTSPPRPGRSLPVFRDVFADIGDEQSIAQSLSTFSGHLRSIIRIVEHAGPGTLVLLDELGAGTDPTEGSALAQALLD